jgi:hypothetical protein
MSEHIKKCPITNNNVIDDCHIRIEFGYGSDLDLTTYEFSRDVTEETFGL